jgi:hypothetical protein
MSVTSGGGGRRSKFLLLIVQHSFQFVFRKNVRVEVMNFTTRLLVVLTKSPVFNREILIHINIKLKRAMIQIFKKLSFFLICSIVKETWSREKNVQSVESRIFKSDSGLDWTNMANQTLSIRIKI